MDIVIQSFVDLITNSSTEVYPVADNVKGVEHIINKVLEAAGSDKTCSDLFTIELSGDEKYVFKSKDETNLEIAAFLSEITPSYLWELEVYNDY